MEQLPEHSQVLIVGAGPSGMTLALTLARAGLLPTLLDKRPHTREYSQALLLWPRTLEILDMLGIAELWREKSIPVHTFRLSVGGKSSVLDLEAIHGPYPFPWAVGQDVTEAILEAEVRRLGIPLFRSVEVLEVTLSEVGARVTVQTEEHAQCEITCEWIVGCEGSKSVVREASGIQRQGGKNPVQLVQGDVRLRGPLALAANNAFLFSDGSQDTLLIVPTSIDGHYRVLITVPDDGNREAPTVLELQERLNEFIPGMEVYDPAWLNRFRVQHQIADTFRNGRALIAGDTAHVWVPIGGQGMNIAMQDSFDLGWKLAGVGKGELQESALDTYSTERRPIGEATIRLTERVYDALLNPRGLMANLQRWILPVATERHKFVSFVSERFGQADFEYPKSELVVAQGGTARILAGQRAPDAIVQQAGLPVRFYELLRSGRWLLLGWVTEKDDSAGEALSDIEVPPQVQVFLVDSTRKGAASPLPVLRDVGHIALHGYGVKESCILVIRPDGVVGYSGTADSAPLMGYFEKIFG